MDYYDPGPNSSEDHRDEVVDAGTARKALQDIMSYATREMGDRKSLTAAADAVRPWDPKRQVLTHPYDGDLTLLRMSAQEAAQYLCGRTGCNGQRSASCHPCLRSIHLSMNVAKP